MRILHAARVCTRRLIVSVAAAVAVVLAPVAAVRAADFSFTGAFTRDDDMALFGFSVAAGPVSLVTLRTSSYATGGFDPVLSLFRASDGLLLADNDDVNAAIPTGTVPADPTTGLRSDSFLEIDLEPGAYLLALTQYDNLAAGPNLANGFARAGTGNFTGGPFLQSVQQAGGGAINHSRTGNYSVQILNVTSAQVIPEPGTLALIGFAGLGGSLLRRCPQRKKAA